MPPRGYYLSATFGPKERTPLTVEQLRALPLGTLLTLHTHPSKADTYRGIIRRARSDPDHTLKVVPIYRTGELLKESVMHLEAHEPDEPSYYRSLAWNYSIRLIDDPRPISGGNRGRKKGTKIIKATDPEVNPNWLRKPDRKK